MRPAEKDVIQELQHAVSELLAGRSVSAAPSCRTEHRELHDLSETLRRLVTALREAGEFITRLSQGDLGADPPARNFLISPFKQLHSSLRHLTWQAQQIAAGDLSQHVDFLGDFATAFNSMIQSLREKRRTEEALRESEERFRRMAENIQDVFWLVEAGENTRLAYISPAVERIWGRRAEEVYADLDLLLEAIHAEDKDSVKEAIWQLLRSGKDFSAEHRIVRPDGSICWVWSKGFAIRDDSAAIRMAAGITQDISRKKLDEEKQRQLHQEIRNFTYIVSHDLRAPLINLKGFSRILGSQMEEIRPAVQAGLDMLPDDRRSVVQAAMEEEIPEALRFISSSVSRMDGLIEAILRLSRNGHRELEFARVNMQHLVEDTLATLAHQIEEKGAIVSCGPLPEITADRTAMEQIFGNLLDNAIKYIDPQRKGRIEVTGYKSGDEAVFRVIDNGRGIRQADLARIFDVFQRAGNQDVQGEGMGLAHVRTLVRRHGGRIWCESEPGVGSTFTFTISMRLEEGVHLS